MRSRLLALSEENVQMPGLVWILAYTSLIDIADIEL